MLDEQTPIRQAIISVSDKTGLIEFVKFLSERGVTIISTGGTAKTIRAQNIKVLEVEDYTGFPEILDGRVKTLHPKIYGGILGLRNNSLHVKTMAAHNFNPIDLVVVNLYPFENTIAAETTYDNCIENIDIGGPTLIRAAAKNHKTVTVVTDIEDYQLVMQEMKKNAGSTSLSLRQRLASIAYSRTAAYDSIIANWFIKNESEVFPRRFSFSGKLCQTLRYGENPHQNGAFYLTESKRPGVASAKQIQGKELSYNNLNDTDAAFELVAEFDTPAAAIIKHANPCGVALGNTLADAFEKAKKCDPVSAFGGILAVNNSFDVEIAKLIENMFLEVVIAPNILSEARQILSKKKNLRVLETGKMPDPKTPALITKELAGGFLLQERDNGRIREEELRVVTKKKPNVKELSDLLFAFRVCKHVKSNAIVYAKNSATVGIGAGQMSRVDSVRIAVQKSIDAAESASENIPLTKDSVVASDAFFPFADGLSAAAKAGVTAVIQPGGSIRDKEVIDAANAAGLSMVFTDIRHFKH